MAKTVLQSYGDYVATSQQAPLSPQVQHHASRALLDWHAALIAGSDLPAADLLRNAYADELPTHPPGPCSVAGTPLKARLRAAAFLNGTLSHLAEYDDIYRDAVYHPASPTISAVFALAQSRGMGLHALRKAIVAGYEVSTRIGSAVQPSHYAFFHTTGTVGVFGASAACASLLQLNAQQACDAMATAGTFASGLQQAFRSDSMTKPMHAGHAAEVGLNAALTAQAGMTGTADLLEGAAGFGAAMSQGARWEQAVDGLGHDFNITRMTFKNYGCCGHTFASIDAAASLQHTHHISPEAIASIHIGTYRAGTEVCAYRQPSSPFEAKFSLSYTVAARWILGRVREQAFTPEALHNPLIRALEDKISVTTDDDCTRAFPNQRSAKMEVVLHSGERFLHHQTTRHGDPDDPLSDAELLDKFYELTVPRIGLVAAQAIAKAVMGQEDLPVAQIAQYWSAA